MKINDLKQIAKKYRKEMFEKFLLTKQGHPGSIFSIMEIIVCLYHSGVVRFNEREKKFTDKVLISKGHATSVLYPVLRDFGVISKKDWDNWGVKDSQLRIFGNISIPGIDVTSGSLGHGVGYGAGLALHYLKNNIDKKVYVVISEGELYEGSTWEALLLAKHNSLKNLIVIIDINNLIILGNTNDCLKLNPIEDKIKGLGIIPSIVDGHNIDEILKTFNDEVTNNDFKCILAKTIKGKGASIMESKPNWHYMNSMSNEEITKTREELEQ